MAGRLPRAFATYRVSWMRPCLGTTISGCYLCLEAITIWRRPCLKATTFGDYYIRGLTTPCSVLEAARSWFRAQAIIDISWYFEISYIYEGVRLMLSLYTVRGKGRLQFHNRTFNHRLFKFRCIKICSISRSLP